MIHEINYIDILTFNNISECIMYFFLVQEVYEELLEAEDDWNKFLESADQALSSGLVSPASEGEFIKNDNQLQSVRF